MRPPPKEAPMRIRSPRKMSFKAAESISGAQSGSFSRASGHCMSSSAHCVAAHHLTPFSRVLQTTNPCSNGKFMLSHALSAEKL